MKKIGLMAVDSQKFNLALGKISAWHKTQGDLVEWYDFFTEYDIVYMSKIFNFTPDYPNAISNAKEVKKGGTGYDFTTTLPIEIDRLQPDYSIYPIVDQRTSYGFLTRGCPNKCAWCVVPKKEGAVKPYMDIDEITLDGKRPYAVLMDNNILASNYGLQQIQKIGDKKYHVDFNQALDARLVTEDVAQLLARMKWMNSVVRFGCDTPKHISECENAMALMGKYGFKGQWMLYTMIYGKVEECYERLAHWRTSKYFKKVRLLAQPFRNPNKVNQIPQWQKDMARWSMRREFYATCDFKDFSPRKGFKCGTYFENNG